MTGAMRAYWWLLLGLSVSALGLGVMASAGLGSVSCSDLVLLPYGETALPTSPCADQIESAQRMWTNGLVLLIAGLLVIAYGFGYRRGRRGSRYESASQAS